ncbi:flippase-like domain-containing protein [candidate division WOR-3 bacterium]|nr:flippase-like domain-containing protein [candidate division WOR-3 bacterium]
MKDTLKVIARILISAGLLFLVLRKVDFKEIFELLKNANMGIFLTSFIGYAFLSLASTFRWHRLLWAQNVKIPYRRTLAYYLIGFFYNNFLPSVVGGGIVRALYVGRINKKNKEAFSSMLTELLLGSWALLAFAIIVSLCWFRSITVKSITSLLLGIFVLVTVFIYLFFKKGIMRKFKGMIERIKIFELGNKIKECYNAMHIYRNKKILIFEVILFSFGMQIAMALMNLSIGISLGFKLPLMSYVVYPAIIGLLATIPITINGLGLREWGYGFFFAQVGLTGSEAVTLSLLFYFVGVIGSLSGGIIFPFMKFKKNETLCNHSSL